MLMLKLSASLIILLCTTLAGIKRAQWYRQRPRQIRQLIFALQFQRSEIGFGTTLLPDIWFKLGNRLSSPVGNIYKTAYQIYQMQCCDTLTAMTEGVKAVTNQLCLDQDEIDIITFLGKQLGRSDSKDQEKYLELAMAELTQLEISARQEAEKYVRLYNVLGFLSGLMIIIILL